MNPEKKNNTKGTDKVDGNIHPCQDHFLSFFCEMSGPFSIVAHVTTTQILTVAGRND